MLRREGNTIIVQGPVNINNVVDLTEKGLALLENGNLQISLQQITEVDSTAVSMLLEWLREANKKNCRLEFIHLSASLESLMQLYGVTEFIIPLSNQKKPEIGE
ncbi:MAG: STAS domain-containing protein [Burkholderiales bacterium]|nr:STAS domain-containing protein [Nitrosomonas sp.]MCP5274736.1 STAS domain-containing protein [Burkholderiales bacterium]